jgi:hypothetical protein
MDNNFFEPILERTREVKGEESCLIKENTNELYQHKKELQKDKKSRERLDQKEAEKRVKERLKNTPYILKKSLVFTSVRTTKIDLHCTLHNYDWCVSWHHLMYHSSKHNILGCKYCKIQYTKDLCLKAALECKHRSEFARKHKGEYFAALRNGWLDDICSHMEVLGNRYKRCIYAYEFPNIDNKKYVYVGLTDNIAYRDRIHGIKGSVFLFCKKHEIPRPNPIQLTQYLCKEEAMEKEGLILSKYIASGWLPINRVKTGGLGGHLSNNGFTFEECKARGQQFSTRSEWKKNDYPTYYIANKRGWMDKIIKQKERYGNSNQKFWTEEKIHEAALKYKYRKDFRRKDSVAYTLACQRGILDTICSHMVYITTQTGYTIEAIKQKIELYETLTDFIKKNPRMYNWLNRNKIKLSEISDKPYKKPIGNPKPIIQLTKEGKFVRRYNNARETEAYGFNFRNVSQVCLGQKKSHKGFIFIFE